MSDKLTEILKLRNLYRAVKKSSSGRMWKCSVALYRWDGLKNSVKLRNTVLRGDYKLQRYLRFRILRPKVRDITATRVRDQHLQRSACDNVLYPAATKSFIYNNGACQRGRGIDFAIARTKRGMCDFYRRQRRERAREQGCRVEAVEPFQTVGWVYKGDVKKYFPSSQHSEARAIIDRCVTDPRVKALFNAIIASFGEPYWHKTLVDMGVPHADAAQAARLINDARTDREYIPLRREGSGAAILAKSEAQIRKAVSALRVSDRAELIDRALHGDARNIALGSQPSQLLQLAQLDAIDHYATEVARVEFYERYMDDYIMIDRDREKLERTADRIEFLLNRKGLELNPKSQIINIKQGFLFLRWHFILPKSGSVVMHIAQNVVENERRRLRRMTNKIESGVATVDSLQRHYAGWRAHLERGDVHRALEKMDAYFGILAEEVNSYVDSCKRGAEAVTA